MEKLDQNGGFPWPPPWPPWHPWLDARLKAELGDLKRVSANCQCFDCGAADVTWASPKLGTFLCAPRLSLRFPGGGIKCQVGWGKTWENASFMGGNGTFEIKEMDLHFFTGRMGEYGYVRGKLENFWWETWWWGCLVWWEKMDSCGENDLVYWRIWNGNLNRKMIRWSGIYIYILCIYICVCLYIYINSKMCIVLWQMARYF